MTCVQCLPEWAVWLADGHTTLAHRVHTVPTWEHLCFCALSRHLLWGEGGNDNTWPHVHLVGICPASNPWHSVALVLALTSDTCPPSKHTSHLRASSCLDSIGSQHACLCTWGQASCVLYSHSRNHYLTTQRGTPTRQLHIPNTLRHVLNN